MRNEAFLYEVSKFGKLLEPQAIADAQIISFFKRNFTEGWGSQ